MLKWFIPTFHGDLKLERLSPTVTQLGNDALTPTEREAVIALLGYASKKSILGEPWWTGDPVKAIDSGSFINLNAPIEKVSKALAKALKPGRKVMSVVKVKDGKIQEVYETEAVKTLEKAVVGTTVAAPTRGCPAPVFDAAEMKAQRVLKAFLTDGQIKDFEKHQSFVTTGATTGHRYAVTSRLASDRLAQYRRSLYDLTEQRAYCVHDWVVPPAEEMLALHLFLKCPGREQFLRDIPERAGDGLVIGRAEILYNRDGRPIQG